MGKFMVELLNMDGGLGDMLGDLGFNSEEQAAFAGCKTLQTHIQARANGISDQVLGWVYGFRIVPATDDTED